MRPPLVLHGRSVILAGPPRPILPILGLLGGLSLAVLFGAGATLLLNGAPLPRLLPPSWREHTASRTVMAAIGALNCFLSVLVASGFGIRALAILSLRTGRHPVRESEGPCRLVEDAPGLWALRMTLSSGHDPGVRWPITTAAHIARDCHLLFRLDEAAAGAVSHLTDPDERLVVRWMDLPSAFGGPTLVELRSRAQHIQVEDASDEVRRAA
jgi:hypothetical protein